MSQPKEPAVSKEFEPFVRALGVLSLAWSHLEYDLNELIWVLSNVDRQFGACLTAQLIGPGPRIRAVAALLRLRGTPNDLINEFNSLSADIESAGRQRNRWLHDQILWHIPEKKMARIEITADRTPKFFAEQIEPSDIHALSIQCKELDGKLANLLKRVIERSPAWPRTQYDQSLDISQLPLRPRPNSAASK